LPCGHSPPTACRHAVSGTISLPSQGCFSPFPHGTSSLSVTREYLALPDGPGRFSLGSTCPAILRSHLKKDCIFKYGAVTLYGRPFHAVLLTLSYSLFNQEPSTVNRPVFSTFPSSAEPPDYCGPTTPSSRCQSLGLGCSDFARHYFRNHCCFLFLQVLRWFTSLSLLPAPIYSGQGNLCSHRLGSPIRKSPDH
jgi:hypothetical protein